MFATFEDIVDAFFSAMTALMVLPLFIMFCAILLVTLPIWLPFYIWKP